MDSHVLNYCSYQNYWVDTVPNMSTNQDSSTESSGNQTSPEYAQNELMKRVSDKLPEQNNSLPIMPKNYNTSGGYYNIYCYSHPLTNMVVQKPYDKARYKYAVDYKVVYDHDDDEIVEVLTVDPNGPLASDDESVSEGEQCFDKTNSNIGSQQQISDQQLHIQQGACSQNYHKPPMLKSTSVQKDFYHTQNSDCMFDSHNKQQTIVNELRNNCDNIDSISSIYNKDINNIALDTNAYSISHSTVQSIGDYLKVDERLPEELFANDTKPVAQLPIITDADPLVEINKIKSYLMADWPLEDPGIEIPKFQPSIEKPTNKSVERSIAVPHTPSSKVPARPTKSTSDSHYSFDDLEALENCFKNDPPISLTPADINNFFNPGYVQYEQPAQTQLNAKLTHLESTVNAKINECSTVPIPAIKSEFPQLQENTPKDNVHRCFKDKKLDGEDFVDVETCTDTVMPVIEANNVVSLLEQFEQTEQMNINISSCKYNENNKESTMNGLMNGIRQQDAVQLQINKSKSSKTLHQGKHISLVTEELPPHLKKEGQLDHNYCSPENKMQRIAKKEIKIRRTARKEIKIKRAGRKEIKIGRSLLKPEVLSNNNTILNSRHRSCKNKKVVYDISSDEELDNKTNPKGRLIDKNIQMSNVKEAVNLSDSCKKKSVIHKASKATSNDSVSDSIANKPIKLVIRNKSEVILNCDFKRDSKNNIKSKENYKIKDNNITENPLDKCKNTNVDNSLSVDIVQNDIKHEKEPIPETNIYSTLICNKQDVVMPKIEPVKNNSTDAIKEQKVINDNNDIKPVKRKLNLKEYQLRLENKAKIVKYDNLNSTKRQDIFPPILPHVETPTPRQPEITVPLPVNVTVNNQPIEDKTTAVEKTKPKQLFDPIAEASRKALLKKQKKKINRVLEEDIIISKKISKVSNLRLEPLISGDEIIKIDSNCTITKEATANPLKLPEKQIKTSDYEERTVVSIGVNTDQNIFRNLRKEYEEQKQKIKQSAPNGTKPTINFKIKTSETVSKANIFDSKRHSSSKQRGDHTPTADATCKIDKKRFEDITAVMKSYQNKIDTKISSNSLFASIHDVVMKKAPEENLSARHSLKETKDKPTAVSTSAVIPRKTVIVRDYDNKEQHGEDKVILHLEKNRSKATCKSKYVQTGEKPLNYTIPKVNKSSSTSPSDVSINKDKVMSLNTKVNAGSNNNNLEIVKASGKAVERKGSEKPSKDNLNRNSYRSESKDINRRYRSRSKSVDYYKSRQSRKASRSPKRSKPSRSPYRSSQRRSRSRSHHRENSSRYQSNSKSTSTRPQARSPMPKKLISSDTVAKISQSHNVLHKGSKQSPSTTPPLPYIRTPKLSESSTSSSSSSSSGCSKSSCNSSCSSSSSSLSNSSTSSRSSSSNDDSKKLSNSSRIVNKDIRTGYKKPYSSEERDSNPPVEERRIVFVGKLPKDINKYELRQMFRKFGQINEVTLHTKDNGTRYGFVTYQNARSAFDAVGAASSFPKFDVGFGGRRAFCKQRYADLDGLQTQSADIPYVKPLLPFDQMLKEFKNIQRFKSDRKYDNP